MRQYVSHLCQVWNIFNTTMPRPQKLRWEKKKSSWISITPLQTLHYQNRGHTSFNKSDATTLYKGREARGGGRGARNGKEGSIAKLIISPFLKKTFIHGKNKAVCLQGTTLRGNISKLEFIFFCFCFHTYLLRVQTRK